MSFATPTIADFSRGELSPLFDGHVDLPQIYGHGLRLLEEMIVLPSGCITAMVGTRFLAEVKDSTRKTRAFSFAPDSSHRYTLEVGHEYIRFFTAHAPVLSGGVAFEVATTYQESELFGLDLKAYGSVLYIAAEAGHALATLTWSGTDTGWALADFAFAGGSVDFTSDPSYYPSCVSFRDQRLVLAATTEKPLTVWESAVGDFSDFDITGGGTITTATAAEWTVAAQGADRILWVINLKDGLLAGAAAGEILIMPSSALGLNPTENPVIDLRTNFGSTRLGAIAAGENPLFVQRDGETVREYLFSNDQQAWRSPEISFFSNHILEGGVAALAYQGAPQQLGWFVRSEGELVGVTIQRDLQVYGWHHHTFAGFVESAAVLSGAQEDELNLVVKRTVGGQTKRFIEYTAARRWTDPRDAYHLNCGITFDGGDEVAITGATAADPVVITAAGHGFSDGDQVRIREVLGMTDLNEGIYTVANAAADTFELAGLNGSGFAAYISGGIAEKVTDVVTGLDHLEGETVAVVADGARLTDQVVDGGEVALEQYGNTIHVGINVRRRMKLMRLEGGGQTGPSQGKLKRVSDLVLRFYKTAGLLRTGRADSDESLQRMVFRRDADPAGYATPLFSGDYPLSFPGAWDRNADVWIVAEDPLPVTILAVMPEFETVE